MLLNSYPPEKVVAVPISRQSVHSVAGEVCCVGIARIKSLVLGRTVAGLRLHKVLDTSLFIIIFYLGLFGELLLHNDGQELSLDC